VPELRNRYYGLRHGRSVANEQGIIVSTLANGEHAYGLTELGAGQVRASIAQALHHGVLDSSTLLYTSPFLRARESAQLAAELLAQGGAASAREIEIEIADELRERDFGAHELGPDHLYPHVWALDSADPTQGADGVEPVAAVWARTRQLIERLERQHKGATLLLVTHGDTLSITRTGLAGRSLSTHHAPPLLLTGELTALV
jgi:probable phosphoglycerate mutase